LTQAFLISEQTTAFVKDIHSLRDSSDRKINRQLTSARTIA